jgi:hypothetical protein
MSKKAMTSMKDENQELQKQIGCISGFFQLFDRHRFLTSHNNSSNSHNIPNQGNLYYKILISLFYFCAMYFEKLIFVCSILSFEFSNHNLCTC